MTDLEPARRLWAGRFYGVLSTQSAAEPGYPFGSVVPYCLDTRGLPVFLFSHLAQHYQNLQAEPRCAFTLFEAGAGDIQQGLRLTCLGDCSPIPAEDAAAHRLFRYYPRGRAYLEELGFRLFRLIPRRFHYNGGFATARWLGTDRVLRTSCFDQDTESLLIECLEKTHSPFLQSRLQDVGSTEEPVRVAGIDPWGLDLRRGDALARLHFPGALASAPEIDAYLQSLS